MSNDAVTETSQIKMSEGQLLALVLEYAEIRHWHRHHTRPAWTSKGYRTPIQGDIGFPDLCLARKDKIIFWECKAIGGKCSPEQATWIEILTCVAKLTKRVIAGVITPHEWDSGAIQKILD